MNHNIMQDFRGNVCVQFVSRLVEPVPLPEEVYSMDCLEVGLSASQTQALLEELQRRLSGEHGPSTWFYFHFYGEASDNSQEAIRGRM